VTTGSRAAGSRTVSSPRGIRWWWTRSTDVCGARAVAWRSASERAAASSGSPPPWIRLFYARIGLGESARDPGVRSARAAAVHVLPKALEFLNDRFMKRVLRERRRRAVFVPPGPKSSRFAKELGNRWRTADRLLPRGRTDSGSSAVLDVRLRRPFLLAMTAAASRPQHPRPRHRGDLRRRATQCGATGSQLLTRLYPWARTKSSRWPAASRRRGRGRVYILSDASSCSNSSSRRSGVPAAGDAERVPSPARHSAWTLASSICRCPLTARRIANAVGCDERGLYRARRLTRYGREVEAMPVERRGASCCITPIRSRAMVAVRGEWRIVHRMTREERDLRA